MDLQTSQPIVLDVGTGSLKAGFAGEEKPRAVVPTLIGRPKHPRVMAGALEGDAFIGQIANEKRGLLTLHHPMRNGIVENWNDMEKIYQHTFNNELKTNAEKHPILLTEAPMNPRRNRDAAAQILFETFNVPALYTSIQAVLALYSSGRTTGVVLDSGDGVTHTVPVYEGFAMTNAIQRIDIAGRDVTEHMLLLLRKAGYTYTTSAEKEIVRIIKEKTCYVSLNPQKEERDGIKAEEFVLPDGQIIKLGAERYRAPEILFNPSIIGAEFDGVHEVVVSSINKVDMDLRRTLYANIVLSGGTTLCRGFGDRLLTEVRNLAQPNMRIKIYAPPERKYSTWIGGSILASLSTFKKLWITAAEYMEDPECIHRKGF